MNRIETPEINLYLCSQLIFNRGSKHVQWNKGSLFNKWCWENRIDTCRKMKPHLLIPHTGINLKLIKHLNVRPETIKILEENIGSKVSYIALRNFLSDISPQARETRKKIQMGLHQTKKVFHSEGNHPLNEKIIHRMEGHIHGYI